MDVSYSDFFFFQAEDGIRDIGVTGVQTCALPISPRVARRGPGPLHRRLRRRRLQPDDGAARRRARRLRRGRGGHLWLGERRGGEEGRSRGAPYHLKKKNQALPSMSTMPVASRTNT